MDAGGVQGFVGRADRRGRSPRDNAGYTGAGYADFTNAAGDSVTWTVDRAAGGAPPLSRSATPTVQPPIDRWSFASMGWSCD